MEAVTSLFDALSAPYEPGGDQRRTLTEVDVSDIRALYANCTYKQVELASMFGVTQGQISKIVNNLQWKGTS